MDALDLSCGIAACWDPKIMIVLSYKSFAGILLFGFIRDLKDKFNILNTYAPYSSRRYFLDKLESCNLLEMGSLILDKDLNLTIKDNKVWEELYI